MSISDELMWRYYELLSDLSPGQIAAKKEAVARGELHPKRAKMDLAREMVARFHGAEAAARAEEEFERVFKERQLPTEMPEFTVVADKEAVWLPRILTAIRFARSTSEAIRAIQQGSVRWDGERITDKDAEIPCDDREHVLKYGKKRFARIRFDVRKGGEG